MFDNDEKSEKNSTEEIGLVTPIPDLCERPDLSLYDKYNGQTS